MLKTVAVADLLPNTWRDFALYPIDHEQVERLASSIDATGFWIGLQARTHPTQKGKYELASGHHRLAAAKLRGYACLDVDVVDLDDEQMLRVMSLENATQRGYSAAAILDSIASCIKFIASRLFDDEASEPGEFSSTEKERNEILGHGIGRDEILLHIPEDAFTEHEVKTALATLKDSGRYAQIINEAVAKGAHASQLRLEEIERKRLLDEQAERLRAEQATRKKAEAAAKVEAATEERKQAEVVQEAKRKAAERAAAQKTLDTAAKQEAANQAKAELLAKRERERQEKADLERQQMEEAARVKEAKHLEHLRSLEEQAEKERQEKAHNFATQATAKGVIFDDQVAQLFKNNHQLDVFRRKVTSPVVAQYIPVRQQVTLAETIIAAAAANGHDATGEFIQAYIDNNIVMQAKAEDSTIILGERLEQALQKIAASRRMLGTAIKDAITGIRAGAPVPPTFTDYLDELETSLTGLVDKLRDAADSDKSEAA